MSKAMEFVSASSPGSTLGNSRSRRTRAGLLVVALGLSAVAVASPPAAVKSSKLGGLLKHSSAVRPWYQIGRASWYGKQFQGHKTANGERFDMNALTCAHRSLPLGSWVRVTNLHNKKSVFLRVNDRGPVPEALVLDLSYAAAQKLGIAGLAQVRIDKVNPSDPEVAEKMVAALGPMALNMSLTTPTLLRTAQ